MPKVNKFWILLGKFLGFKVLMDFEIYTFKNPITYNKTHFFFFFKRVLATLFHIRQNVNKILYLNKTELEEHQNITTKISQNLFSLINYSQYYKLPLTGRFCQVNDLWRQQSFSVIYIKLTIYLTP